MRLYLKILLVFISIFISFLIFLVFLLYNFPYESLIKRANYYLKREADVSLEADKVKYRLPSIWYIDSLILNLPSNYGKVSLARVKIKLKIINFSQLKGFEVLMKNISLDGNSPVKANLSSIDLRGKFIISMLKDDPFKGIKNVALSIGNGRVKSIEYSGFKITDFKIHAISIELFNKDDKFNLNHGMINSDIIRGDLKGYFSKKYIDVELKLIPSKNFFTRYSDLKPMLGSIIDKNGIKFRIKGNIQSPKFVRSNI